jgi:hypothetical protein
LKSNRRAILATLILAVGIFTLVSYKTESQASQSFTEPQKIRCTCYNLHGITKSGSYTRDGILAGKEEWIGKGAILYEVKEDGSLGDFIGYYEFKDTGYGIEGSIQNGTSIDVWVPDDTAVQEWVDTYGDYAYLQIVEGEG